MVPQILHYTLQKHHLHQSPLPCSYDSGPILTHTLQPAEEPVGMEELVQVTKMLHEEPGPSLPPAGLSLLQGPSRQAGAESPVSVSTRLFITAVPPDPQFCYPGSLPPVNRSPKTLSGKFQRQIICTF